MITGVCIFILALSVLVLPIDLSLSARMDLGKNDGGFSVSVFGIRILKDKLYFKHVADMKNDIVVENKGKRKLFHLNTDKSDKRSVARFFDIEFVPYFNLKSISLSASLGKRDDAMFTTVAVGLIRIAVAALAAIVRAGQRVEITESLVPEYNSDALKLDASVKADITAGDLIFSLLIYIKKKIKEAKKNDYTARRASH